VHGRERGGGLTDREAGIEDRVVPAVLVGCTFGLLLVIGVAVAVSIEEQPKTSIVIQELEAYTACLADHGANVPGSRSVLAAVSW
jgi:hypothetical protein